ncbi:hypothetical protein EPN81_04500 [Patescibacteria group bacterium]|nr:MAG: hypothetical protein EPN81_04500 [Patescibacteria group bacterium]
MLNRPLIQILLLFCVAFILNVLWEEAHHFLYVSYQGGEITQFILLRAALVDAIVTMFLFGPLFFLPRDRRFLWISVVLAFMFGVGLERFALATNRWTYQSFMPLVPFLGTGLTPTVQLAILGAIAVWLSYKMIRS